MRWPGTAPDRWVFLCLTSLAVYFFREAVAGGLLFARDISMVWYAQVESFVRSIAAGSWPTWDPWRGFGQPQLADPEVQAFYPTTWLNLVLPLPVSCTVYVLVHLVLAGTGAYALARRFGLSAIAAFAAGGIYLSSGPILSLTTLWHHFAGAALMPWVLLAADRALGEKTRKDALVWGAVAAGQFFAGSIDLVLMTGLVTALLAAMRHLHWREGLRGANREALRSGAIAFLLALGLAAAQWMPTLAVARRSVRWELPAADRLTWSLHPIAVSGMLWPVWIDRLPPLRLDSGPQRELQSPLLPSLYLGAAAAALVLSSLAGRGRPYRSFLIVLTAAAGLLALGAHTPAYEAVATAVPPLRMIRYPVKWMAVVALGWSLLAGMGAADGMADPRRRRSVVVALAVLAILAITGATIAWTLDPGRLRPYFSDSVPLDRLAAAVRSLGARLAWGGFVGVLAAVLVSIRIRMPASRLILIGLVLLDLGFVHRKPQPVAPRELLAFRPEALDHLDRSRYSRVYVYDYSVAGYPGHRPPAAYDVARLPRGWSDTMAGRVLGVHLYLNPPTAGRWRVFGSYDIDLQGLQPAPVRQLTELLRRVEGTPTHLRLLRMGAVSRVLALAPQSWWRDLSPLAEIPGLFQQPIRVFAVPAPLPRAYAVAGVRIADGGAALAAIQDPAFDPAREVILPSGEAREAHAGSPGEVRIDDYRADRVRLEASLDRSAYVVLVDGYDPSWRATVDGRPVVVQRANVAFRAVPVPAGHHRIEFRYRPAELVAGLLISAATLIVLLAAWARVRR